MMDRCTILCLFLALIFYAAAAAAVDPRNAVTFQTFKLAAPPQDDGIASPRIAWGEHAVENQFPFAVYLYAPHYACTATLIAPRVVLTAAHCVLEYGYSGTVTTSPSFRLGSINRTLGSFNYAVTVIMPKFNRNTYYGDLAILELKHASDLKPLALPTMYTKPASVSRVTAVGWGNTELINEPEGLRYTNLTTMNASTCDSQHKEIYKKFSRPLGTMCFGMAGHKSTCGGDSGGPIFIPSSPARAEPVLVGVTSYNFYKYKCGNQTSRGLPMATSVPYWSEWIKNTMSFYNLLGTTMPLRYNSAAGDSVCFSGLSLASKKTVYAGECTEFCRSHAACKAWTYRSDLRTCTLKSTLAPVTKYLDACVSGYMDD